MKQSVHAFLFTKYNHCYCHVITVPQQETSGMQQKTSGMQEKTSSIQQKMSGTQNITMTH